MLMHLLMNLPDKLRRAYRRVMTINQRDIVEVYYEFRDGRCETRLASITLISSSVRSYSLYNEW